MTARLLLPALAAASLALTGCEAFPNPFLIAFLATEGPCSLPGSELLPDCGDRLFVATPEGRPVPVEDEPDEDDDSPTDFISLGFDSELLVDERVLDFGSLEPAWTATAEVLLFNDGQEPVSGGFFLDRGDAGFRLGGDEERVEFALEPGEELTFELVFAPPRADEYSDRLRVEDDDDLPLTDLALRGRAEGLSDN